MTLGSVPQILPAVMGLLRQQGSEGELLLEQNDGTRSLFWRHGDLVYLRSNAAGEQFGNYLLRQGILDYAALNELLANEEAGRLGEKVIQWGLMSLEERDCHLMSLQEQIMIRALEHPILTMKWTPGRIGISEDLHFELKHRHFVWQTFQEAQQLGAITDLLYQESDWKWVAPGPLMDSLSDLPLNPQVAYAFSFLGAEPVSYETFIHLSGMDEEEAARLITTLWALGSLDLAADDMSAVRPLLTTPPGPAPTRQSPFSPLGPASPTPGSIPPIEMDTPARSLLDNITGPESFKRNSPEPALEQEIPEAVDTPLPCEPTETPAQRSRQLFIKGKNFAQRDRTVEAIRALEQGLQLNPDSEIAFEPWLILGKLRMANPAWSTRAIEALQSAAKLRPRAPEPWALMGELYHRKGFKTNALACFRKAVELDPSCEVPADIDLKEETHAESEPVEEPKGFLERIKAAWFRQS